MTEQDPSTTIVTCPECTTRFVAPLAVFLPRGRQVRCSGCKHVWFHSVSELQDGGADEKRSPNVAGPEGAAADEMRGSDGGDEQFSGRRHTKGADVAGSEGLRAATPSTEPIADYAGPSGAATVQQSWDPAIDTDDYSVPVSDQASSTSVSGAPAQTSSSSSYGTAGAAIAAAGVGAAAATAREASSEHASPIAEIEDSALRATTAQPERVLPSNEPSEPTAKVAATSEATLPRDRGDLIADENGLAASRRSAYRERTSWIDDLISALFWAFLLGLIALIGLFFLREPLMERFPALTPYLQNFPNSSSASSMEISESGYELHEADGETLLLINATLKNGGNAAIKPPQLELHFLDDAGEALFSGEIAPPPGGADIAAGDTETYLAEIRNPPEGFTRILLTPIP